MKECLILLEEMQTSVPHAALLGWPKLPHGGKSSEDITNLRSYHFACIFYDIMPVATAPEDAPIIPFSSIFNNFTSISLRCAQKLVVKPESPEVLREVLSRTLSLMDNLTTRLDSPIAVTWEPQEWLSSVLSSFGSDVSVR